MKEYPMLFNGPMVRAILEGTKTQTRRMMKKQPNIDPRTGDWLFTDSQGKQEVHPIEQWINIQVKLHCPYGKVGDRLWVRETFNYFSCDCHEPCSHSGWKYKADEKHYNDDKWRPSIHMPRTASRIMLEITDVRAERLIDISDADAIAEGIESFRPVPGDGVAETMHRNYETGKWTPGPRYSFYTLWESVYGPKSFGVNPWVWVISFKRI